MEEIDVNQADRDEADPLPMAPMAEPNSSDDTERAGTKKKIVFWIALGIIVWGTVLALGVFLVNHDARQSAAVFASVVIFVGFWLLMLRNRRSVQEASEPKRPNVPGPPASGESRE